MHDEHCSPFEELERVRETVFENMAKFKNTINIFIDRGESAYESVGRIHTEDEANGIDDLIQLMLHQYGIPFRVISRNDVADILNMISR